MSPGSRGPERGQVHGQDGSDHLITGHHQDTTPPPDVAQILNDDPLPCLSASRLQKERRSFTFPLGCKINPIVRFLLVTVGEVVHYLCTFAFAAICNQSGK